MSSASVLSTSVLETLAASPSPQVSGGAALDSPARRDRLFQPGTGDEPRRPGSGKRAPAQTTGISSVSPDVNAQRAKESSDFYMGLAEKGVAILGDSVKRMASKDAREQAN